MKQNPLPKHVVDYLRQDMIDNPPRQMLNQGRNIEQMQRADQTTDLVGRIWVAVMVLTVFAIGLL